jgi:tetratricopeptide (TPR) repeat protein
MHHLDVGHALPPFWSQMPRFFAYPFSLNGVLFLALLALLSIGSAKMFDRPGILMLLPAFIVVSLVIRQGLRVIEFCSQGRARPPSIPELFDGNPTTLKMLGLMLAYGMMVGVLGRFGLLGVGAIFCLSALLPASIMLLAIHRSLRASLDPIRVIELAARTGWSYLGLVLVLIVTSQGPQQAMHLMPAATLKLLAQSSPQMLLAIFVVTTAYFNMVMGAMMGYLLFQHHQDLDIELDDAHAAAPADQRALALARAVILVRESRYEDALRQMAGTVVDYPNDLPVLEYHHKLLCESGGDPDRVVQHTERYLQVLVDARRKGRLVGAFEAARRVLPQYQPKSIALRRALAEEYFLQRQFKPAIALIGMLHKEVPTSDELPSAYLLLARIYSEGTRDDGKAVMILDFLLKQFPGHALAGEIAHYRKVILSLGSVDQAGACAAT